MPDDDDLLDAPEGDNVEAPYARWLGDPTVQPVGLHDVMGQPTTIEQLAERVRRAQDEELGYDQA